MKFLGTFHVANGENERREIRYVRYSDSVIVILYLVFLPCRPFFDSRFTYIFHWSRFGVHLLVVVSKPTLLQVAPAMCWMIFNFCRRMMFFPSVFLSPKFGSSVATKLPRNNTAFWNLFSGHVFFFWFDSLKRCCWNCCKTWFLRLKVLGEDEVPLKTAAIVIAFGCERFIIWSLRLATELLRNSAPVMKHGGLGHPTKKKIFWPRKGNRNSEFNKSFNSKKRVPSSWDATWRHDDLMTPVTWLQTIWQLPPKLGGLSQLPQKWDPEAADAPSANNLQDCGLGCESWTWRMPAIVFLGRLFLINIGVCFGSSLQHQKMMNDGLRTVLHFTGQSTMPETKFCWVGVSSLSYQCLVAVGATYHPTTSAHSYNTDHGIIFCWAGFPAHT